MNTQDVIATLNALLQTTKDGALGFRSCAKDVKSANLPPMFEVSAQRCDTAPRNWKPTFATSGSVTGALHRTWTNVVASLTGMMSMPCWKNASAAKMQQCAHMGRRFKRICPRKSGDRPSSICRRERKPRSHSRSARSDRASKLITVTLFHFYARRGH